MENADAAAPAADTPGADSPSVELLQGTPDTTDLIEPDWGDDGLQLSDGDDDSSEEDEEEEEEEEQEEGKGGADAGADAAAPSTASAGGPPPEPPVRSKPPPPRVPVRVYVDSTLQSGQEYVSVWLEEWHSNRDFIAAVRDALQKSLSHTLQPRELFLLYLLDEAENPISTSENPIRLYRLHKDNPSFRFVVKKFLATGTKVAALASSLAIDVRTLAPGAPLPAKARPPGAAGAAGAPGKGESRRAKSKAGDEGGNAAASAAAAAAAATGGEKPAKSAEKEERSARKKAEREETKKKQQELREKKEQEAKQRVATAETPTAADAAYPFKHTRTVAEMLVPDRETQWKEGLPVLNELVKQETDANVGQMLLYGSCSRVQLLQDLKARYTADPERKAMRRAMQQYVHVIMQYVLASEPVLELPDSVKEHVEKVQAWRPWGMGEAHGSSEPEAIAALWGVASVRERCMSLQSVTLPIPSLMSWSYFFDNIGRVLAVDYLPTQQDLIVLPTLTTRVTVFSKPIIYDKGLLRITDTGSPADAQFSVLKNLRTHAIVFWIDLTEYADPEGLKTLLEHIKRITSYMVKKNTLLKKQLYVLTYFSRIEKFKALTATKPLSTVFPGANDKKNHGLDWLRKQVKEAVAQGVNHSHLEEEGEDSTGVVLKYLRDVMQNELLMLRLAAQFGDVM